MTVPGANRARHPANTTQTGLAAGRSGNFHDTGRAFCREINKAQKPAAARRETAFSLWETGTWQPWVGDARDMARKLQ
jgi:hypothetical protein